MAEGEKFFIAKKNMNVDYAAMVTAARPRDLQAMVEVCTSYDETRMLLERQRRIPVPHSSLLEPNFATPASSVKPFHPNQTHMTAVSLRLPGELAKHVVSDGSKVITKYISSK
ncbi:uncharacterized protein LOC134210188 [Armigeres subalbatus]|uniref:uncharacterized protein LOC134210188 n=1 Tax=Armigeres subalbatus TaxID=124917 RepID=UPI002ED64904